MQHVQVKYHLALSRCPLLHKRLQPPVNITDCDITWELKMAEYIWLVYVTFLNWKYSLKHSTKALLNDGIHKRYVVMYTSVSNQENQKEFNVKMILSNSNNCKHTHDI